MLRAVSRRIARAGTGIVVVIDIALLHNFCAIVTTDHLSLVRSLRGGYDLSGIIVRYDLVVPTITIASTHADTQPYAVQSAGSSHSC